MSDMSSKSSFFWLSCSQFLFPYEALCILFLETGPSRFGIPAVPSHPLQLCSSSPHTLEYLKFQPWTSLMPSSPFVRAPKEWSQLEEKVESNRKAKAKRKSNPEQNCTQALFPHTHGVWEVGTIGALVFDQVVASSSYSESCWQCLLW